MRSYIFLLAALVIATTASAQTRDPWLWPFSAESIWNTPLGEDAQYAGEGHFQPRGGFGTDTEFHYRLSAGAQKRKLFRTTGWPVVSEKRGPFLRDVLMDDDIVVATQVSNNCAAFLQPDGVTLVQLEPFLRFRPGGDVYGIPKPFHGGVKLTGNGEEGTHWGSGLSAFGGSLRHGELTGAAPIRHALKINVLGKKYLHYDRASKTPGYRWPATNADGYAGKPANEGGYAGSDPKFVMGALLAIAPRHTAESLGLITAPAKKLLAALQNYGAYIVDDTGNEQYHLSVSHEAEGEFAEVFGHAMTARHDSTGAAKLWHDDMLKLFSTLSVVDNNRADSIGGGGERRAPLAPAFGPMDNTPPATPTSVVVGKTTPRTVALTWAAAKDDAGLSGYWIYNGARRVAETLGRTSVTVAGLASDTEHVFTVRARDTGLNLSAPSTAVTVRTPALPPGSYEDDFEGDMSAWKLTDARHERGTLILQNWKGGASAWLGGKSWEGAFTLRCSIALVGTAAANQASVHFSRRDEANTAWLEFGGTGPQASLTLWQSVGGKKKKLAAHQGWSARTLEVSRDAAGMLTVRAIDGEKAQVLFDKIPAEPSSGGLGFRTSFQQLTVDNLRVTVP